MRLSSPRRIGFAASCLLGACSAAAPGPAGPIPHVLVVLNKADNTAVFLEGMTLRELGRAPTGDGPHEAAASPDGRFVYVANYGHQVDGHTITVLDVARRAADGVIDLGDHRRPHGLALTRDGRTLWVTCEAGDALVGVDTATRTVSKAIPTGDKGSHMVVLSTDERRAFTANMQSSTVSVLDLAEGRRVALVPCGKGPEGIAISPDGAEVWVGNRGAESLTVIDAATLKPSPPIPAGRTPIRVKITPDGRRAIVSHYVSEDLRIFDVAARRQILLAPVGGIPIGVLVVPDGRHLYVARSRAGTVALVDLDTGAVVREARTGNEPDGLAIAVTGVPAP